ncbi:OLC1v1004600C1 [Oldenlandia corymbosa var. corymbosa]|uniref:OLC1v1004600C1 n=1 Tax=Oldenlandia corymbosa var. corymbosa TaxID=529605 RepID=A0AAV1DDY1_OLDCO|nr:OLC1v1004600C1 [Oldenlandia corymbosa var. corymbosa]
MAMAAPVELLLGSIAFATFWVLAVFPAVPFLPIGRTAGSLLGATLMVIFRVITPDQAYAAINLPILGLLFGTMVVSTNLERADLFKYLGKLLSWRSMGPKDLLCRICIISAISSALFTNDTSCVVLTEFVLIIARQHNLPPHPFLLALASSANIGSSATPIGNPQNLVIAIQNVEAPASVEMVAEEEVISHRFSPATMSHFTSSNSEELDSTLGSLESLNSSSSSPDVNGHKNNQVETIQNRGAVNANETHKISTESKQESVISIGDLNIISCEEKSEWKRLYWKTCVYLVTIGMLISLLIGLNMSWTAVTAALALVVLDFKDARPCLEKVSYSLLIFFCGMFITVDGFNKTGIPSAMWNFMEPYSQINRISGMAILSLVILFLSNLASNVPTVLLLGARVAASAAAISPSSEKKAWLLLAFVSTVAGNLSLLGSAANLIVHARKLKLLIKSHRRAAGHPAARYCGASLLHGGEFIVNMEDMESLNDLGQPAMFPDDIILEILLHLPKNYQVRFCLVCKSWQNLITSPDTFKLFNHQISSSRQNINGTANDFLLLANCCEADEEPEVQIRNLFGKLKEKLAEDEGLIRTHRLFFEDEGEISFVGCCDGLLCFVKHGKNNGDVYLCNPVLGQVRALPMTEFTPDHICGSKNTLAAFFYDDHSSDYKVVKMIDCAFGLKVGVYSLRSNSWTILRTFITPRSQGFFLLCLPSQSSRAKFLVHNRRVYILLYRHGMGILDVSKEEAPLVFKPTPEPLTNLNKIFLFEGSVAVSSHLFPSSYGYSDLWVFQEDANDDNDDIWQVRTKDWEKFWTKKSVPPANRPTITPLPSERSYWVVIMGTNEKFSQMGSNWPAEWRHLVVTDYVPSLISIMFLPLPPPPPPSVGDGMKEKGPRRKN